MSIKVIITDLQTKRQFLGKMDRAHIELGRDFIVPVSNYGGKVLRIPHIKGWLSSDSYLIHYLVDGNGRRFKLQILARSLTVIDSR
jgi:hypothetical protein